MIILPAIDILDGQAVRLYQGDYATAHKVAADPVETALTCILAFSPSRIIVPAPYALVICAIAVSRAFFLSTAVSFPAAAFLVVFAILG